MAWSRREVLRTLALAAAWPHRLPTAAPLANSCWLEVLIPFIVQNPDRRFRSQIVLPSATFPGREGFWDLESATQYEILGYDERGKELTTGRFQLPPMHTTLVDLAEIFGNKGLTGGARVRMRPQSKLLTHYADLFSAAFVRWEMGSGFSYVHGYPNPPNLQRGDYSSVLTKPRTRQPAYLSVFNPNRGKTQAVIKIYHADGRPALRAQARLGPYQTRIFDLLSGRFLTQAGRMWEEDSTRHIEEQTILVESAPGKPRVFFFFVTGDGRSHFANEHPVLLGGFQTRSSQASPFTSDGRFQTRGLVYSPLFFNDYRTRGLTLRSCAYLGSGRPVEDPQWLQPFISGGDGRIYWSSRQDEDLTLRIERKSHRGVLQLAPCQVQRIAASDLPLEGGFAGGLAVACHPVINHTLMKIEVEVAEWDRVTFSHFRPGSVASHNLLQIEAREGLVSDYVISGLQIAPESTGREQDSLLSFMNIEVSDQLGQPRLEIFGPRGFIASRQLDSLPPLACRFRWASDLFPAVRGQEGPFSVRLTDERAATVISAVHFDLTRKQLAIDHGSDRFSTYLDYSC